MANSTTLVMGHRGAPRRARENTIEAFELAREEGADGVELDVHLSRDGVLLVHHDAAIDGFGVLAEHPIDAIQGSFPWLPTLEAVLDACAGLLVNIEIKNSPRDADFDPYEAASQAVVDLLRRRDGVDRVLVSSFHLPSINQVHALAPEIATGYLAVMDPAPVDALVAAIAGGHRAIHPFFGVLADRGAVMVVEEAHTVGIQVNTWTVNEPEEIVRLAEAGVDAIITDVPAVAREALG
ncbi:MAG: glycerophosphodiester phosphodiesterase [Acidimicrobiia bacterium]|nr:glycerophosphodiester phosphodiesterase [Acidimicrobiia bacterium]